MLDVPQACIVCHRCCVSSVESMNVQCECHILRAFFAVVENLNAGYCHATRGCVCVRDVPQACVVCHRSCVSSDEAMNAQCECHLLRSLRHFGCQLQCLVHFACVWLVLALESCDSACFLACIRFYGRRRRKSSMSLHFLAISSMLTLLAFAMSLVAVFGVCGALSMRACPCVFSLSMHRRHKRSL